MKTGSILISLLAIMVFFPQQPQLWQLKDGEIQAYSITKLSKIIMVQPQTLQTADLGNTEDCIDYSGEKISINNCQSNPKKVYWNSPETWKVTEAIYADLNRDGRNELVMVVWRPHKTWPIDSFLLSGGRIADFHDRNGLSCHLILVGWDGDEYRELWAGSSLIDPVFGIRAEDLDKDGHQELVALEGKYDNKTGTGNLTVWDWSGFGFRLRARQYGTYAEFGIVSVNQNVLMLSD